MKKLEKEVTGLKQGLEFTENVLEKKVKKLDACKLGEPMQ